MAVTTGRPRHDRQVVAVGAGTMMCVVHRVPGSVRIVGVLLAGVWLVGLTGLIGDVGALRGRDPHDRREHRPAPLDRRG
jgi:hypothetical protein